VAFSFLLVVGGCAGRPATASILRVETFDNRVVNITAVAEVVLAILIAKGVFLPSLLSTSNLTGGKWLIGAAPAVALFVLWELGKAIVRRASSPHEAAVPVSAIPAAAAA
jgi:Ca2+-transporting ATPase